MFKKHAKPPEPEIVTVPVDDAPDTLPPEHVEILWSSYKLRKLAVSATAVNHKYCRVSELGDGFHAVEVEGLEPQITEEPIAVCLVMAEKSAWTGRAVRRFVDSAGVESYR